jgi:DNA-binding transcriptional ArsR family regulator
MMNLLELKPEQLDKAANMLKAIAHPVRIAILNLLEDGQKLTVTEIHEKLEIEQSTTSHHIGIL